MTKSTRPSRRALESATGAWPASAAGYVLESDAPGGFPSTVDPTLLKERIVAALRTVYDPEIPLNIYDLGLVYGLETNPSGQVRLRMTLTAPGCPIAGELLKQVHAKLLGVPGVSRARTELVWDPPWTQDRLTDAAKLELGLL